MELPLFNTTLGYGPTTTGDAVQTLSNSVPTTGFFDSGGLFTKLVDTAGTIYLTKAQIDAQKQATATQANPVVAPGVSATTSAQNALTKVVPYIPYIVGGVFLFVGVIVAVKLARK
jgi:hypothetical protein